LLDRTPVPRVSVHKVLNALNHFNRAVLENPGSDAHCQERAFAVVQDSDSCKLPPIETIGELLYKPQCKPRCLIISFQLPVRMIIIERHQLTPPCACRLVFHRYFLGRNLPAHAAVCGSLSSSLLRTHFLGGQPHDGQLRTLLSLTSAHIKCDRSGKGGLSAIC
jgi:hypothetical protein